MQAKGMQEASCGVCSGLAGLGVQGKMQAQLEVQLVEEPAQVHTCSSPVPTLPWPFLIVIVHVHYT